MAITNAQQYQQLVNKPANGKRPGYRGDKGYQGSTGGSKANDRSSEQQTSNNNAQTGGGGRQDGNQEDSRIFYGPKGETIDIGFQGNLNDREKALQTFKDKRPEVNLFGIANLFKKPIQKFSDFTTAKNRTFFEDVIRGGKIPGLSFDMTEDELEDAYQDYMSNRMSGEIDAYGNPLNQGDDGGDPIIPLMAQAPSNMDQETEEEEPFQRNFRLMNKGGRVGLFKGAQADANAGKGAMSPGTDTDGGFRGGDNGGGDNGGGGPKGPTTNNQKTPVVVNPIKNLSTHFNNNQKLKDAVALGLITNEEYNTLGGYDAKQTLGMGPIDTGLASLGYNVVQSFKGDQKFSDIFGDVSRNVKGATNISPDLQAKYENIMQMADGGRAGFAEGGMPYEGGIMDLETSRQMYGLGKFVKKITRGVKKIAKSPIGKAALGAALFKFGGGFAADGFFKKTLLPKLYTGGKMTGLGKGILGVGVPAALSYFMTPEEEEEKKLYAGADIDDPSYIMNNPSLYTNRRLAAEGGSMDEPVAKKTMPLLDMDGQEMDLRAEGGFVPLGRMERADDVPARLSKNEFVFTADAVRNAGEGDVDKGAEVMYNMMKNLESGGDVSEESQGLEGAREMFQTSQRLEEVI